MAMIVPFKSLRYHGGRNQTWGFQVRRSIRRKNEWACLTALPASMGGPLGFNRVSLYGSLTGIDVPEARRNLEMAYWRVGRRWSTRRLRARYRRARESPGRPCITSVCKAETPLAQLVAGSGDVS